MPQNFADIWQRQTNKKAVFWLDSKEISETKDKGEEIGAVPDFLR